MVLTWDGSSRPTKCWPKAASVKVASPPGSSHERNSWGDTKRIKLGFSNFMSEYLTFTRRLILGKRSLLPCQVPMELFVGWHKPLFLFLFFVSWVPTTSDKKQRFVLVKRLGDKTAYRRCEIRRSQCRNSQVRDYPFADLLNFRATARGGTYYRPGERGLVDDLGIICSIWTVLWWMELNTHNICTRQT